MVVIQSSDPLRASDEIEALHENQTIADLLCEIARMLANQHAGDFRVNAYLAAAQTVRRLPTPIRRILEQGGVDELIALPTIGKSIANLVAQYLRLGRIPLLDRLHGEANAEKSFTKLPGIGHELSHRIYDHLHVESLADLEAAGRDGRLSQVPGLGRKRIQAIKDHLARRTQRKANESHTSYPDTDRNVPVEELLAIDHEYRTKATSNQLPRIAPTRFNFKHEAWLPILRTERNDRHYTASYSNTARAHQLNTTRDWVVIHREDAQSHAHWTVVTSQFGRLRGCRVVRGREDECLKYYVARARRISLDRSRRNRMTQRSGSTEGSF